MKLQDIKSNEDVIIFIEGIINDYVEFGISTKEDMITDTLELIAFCVNKSKKKEVPEFIKKIIDEIDQDKILGKVNEDLDIFETHKRKIYISIAKKVKFCLDNEYYHELEKLFDSIGVYPEKEINEYRKKGYLKK